MTLSINGIKMQSLVGKELMHGIKMQCGLLSAVKDGLMYVIT